MPRLRCQAHSQTLIGGTSARLNSFSDSPPGDYGDGPTGSARFNHPAAVALGADGTLYVADEENNCIHLIHPAKAAGQQ